MIKKLFRQMLVSQVLSAMTVMICMLIDSIMIGRFLGVPSMTAYGLASPVLMVFAAVGSMLTAGINVLCGKTLGNGDKEGTNRCFTVSLTLAAAVSAIGLIAVLSMTGPIAVLLGANPNEDPEIYNLTQDYLRGFIIGAPAFLLAQTMIPYMQLSGRQTRLIAAVAAMTLSDVIFDILNVFVADGRMFGMGLASSLSYYLALIIGITYFFSRKCMFRFNLKLFTGRVAGQLFTGGVPTVINQVSLVLMVYLFNQILLSVTGSNAVAAYSVVSTVGNLCYSFSFGIGSVSLMLSSLFYTDEDRSSLQSLIRTMTYFAVIMDVAVIAAAMAAASPLVGLFIAEQSATRDMAVLGVRLFSLSLLPSALNTAFKNYFQGIDRVRRTYVVSILQCFAFPALFALVLSRFVAETGVWLAYVCGETSTFIVICAMVWIKIKKLSFSADAFSYLPRDFGAKESECCEFTVRSGEEAVEASNKAESFCLSHGESGRNSKLIALCIEEMTVNIVEHGFTKDKKNHNIDVRLLFRDGKRLIRIRDNCVNFDPVNYVRLHEADDDPTAHVGIRMVMKMVKEANYVNTLGLNNLTLEL